MSEDDWLAWCDATAEDEPAGYGEDEEEQEPDPEPGERIWGTAGFAEGGFADGLPGSGELAFLADAAAGPDDRYPGATDGELDGLIAAWDRIEAHASARKHLAVAEFIRRRPEKGCEPQDPRGMPERWDEFAVDELRVLLAESKWRSKVPSRPPAQAAATVERRAAPGRDVPVDYSIRARLHHRTHPLPDLIGHAQGLASGKSNAFN